MSAAMGSSIIQSRSWHEDSGSNEPEQQGITAAPPNNGRNSTNIKFSDNTDDDNLLATDDYVNNQNPFIKVASI